MTSLKTAILAATGLIALSIVPALAGETPAGKDARVYFTHLKDGDTVTSPVLIQFGLSGMGIAPAGTEVEKTGHHHLFIDRPALGKGEDGAEEFNANIIKDEKNVHFGGGQTETSVTLAPGKHTLQLVLGDKDHIPHNPPIMSEVINITVQ